MRDFATQSQEVPNRDVRAAIVVLFEVVGGAAAG